MQTEQKNQNNNNIRHNILVLSGKGGVGKSSIAANLAVWLSLQDQKVGLLDVDIHGPSIPKLLNLEGRRLQGRDNKIEPIVYSNSLKVMSVGFFLENQNTALIWRGPMKHNIIKQFVCDVAWGDLDFLIVDCPPGTGDEPLSIIQLLDKPDGALVVTTPQQLAITDVKKCITFCSQLNLPVLGIIENMSGFVCPHCNQKTEIFGGYGGIKMAADFGIPFLGSIPIDVDMVSAADSGEPFISNNHGPAEQALNKAFKPLLQSEIKTEADSKEHNIMKIAIPVFEGKLSLHFGHCDKFAIIEADEKTGQITNRTDLTPPPHEPGVLPKWLGEQNVNIIIAGGMGQRAQQLFAQNNIEVVVGAEADSPENLVTAYLNKTLQTGANFCDH